MFSLGAVLKKNLALTIFPTLNKSKLNSRQLYSLHVYTHPFTPTSQKYFIELFKTDSFDWKQIYLLPCLVTLDSYSRSFQYKILNSSLYFDKKHFTFRKSTSSLCPSCKPSDETVLHQFYKCNIIEKLWNDLALFFESDFTLFDLTLQAAFLGFLNVDSKLLLLQNHFLLLFKLYIYNSRRSESLILKTLIREIMKFKNIEEKVSVNN